MNIYETDKLLSEYLLFHYGTAEEVLPYGFGPREALEYPLRCVTECLDLAALPADGGRALDLGCAVGRSTFELARHCQEVTGIDYSQSFVNACERMKQDGECGYWRIDEGALRTGLRAAVSKEIDRSRTWFLRGDAMALPDALGTFDVVLMANLIDRLSDPRLCLQRLPELVRSGGQLIITSPYTWLEEFTPKDHWLGGTESATGRKQTLDGLKESLEGAFELQAVKDLPFLIREHARKYQWSVAQASIWRRR